MTTSDLSEQLSIPESKILEYVFENIDIDWSTVTPVRYLDTYLLNDLQSEKVLIYFQHATA